MGVRDPGDRAALPAGPGRRPEGADAALARGSAHERRCCRSKACTSRFGGVQAVADVSFAVDAGELLALIGPNGAGKSTCFNMLNGQLAPDGGIVRLEGRDIVGLRPRADLAAGCRPHLPDHRDLRLAVGARERADGALFARRPPALAARPLRHGLRARRPTRCWARSACSTRPSVPAACWPMAT